MKYTHIDIVAHISKNATPDLFNIPRKEVLFSVTRIQKYILYGLGVLALILAARYALPLAMPFLLGAALALAAEPLVALLGRRLPRSLAAGVGVTVTFALLVLLVSILCGLLIRELGLLADVLPELLEAAKGGMTSLEIFLTDLVARTPETVRPLLIQQIQGLFSDGSALLDRVTGWLLKLASGVLTRLPDSALGFGTGLIASFMISAKLPVWKARLQSRFPQEQYRPLLETAKGLKAAILGWLKAQVKLSGVTWVLVTLGFLLLGVASALLWGGVVALVDAFPILGTGAVLVPWSLLSFAQGDPGRAFGLLGLYGGVTLVRTLLEPKLVGQHLGLDPLVTLAALYAGYRLWGLPGMILSPLLAVVVLQFRRPSC